MRLRLVLRNFSVEVLLIDFNNKSKRTRVKVEQIAFVRSKTFELTLLIQWRRGCTHTSETFVAERRFAAGMADIAYFQTKDFARSLQRALATGGQNRKKHKQSRVILGSLDQPNPFLTLAVTNNGEKRIKNCVKYPCRRWLASRNPANRKSVLFPFRRKP